MKTQTLLRHNVPTNIIGFLLFVITILIGCGVFFNVNRVVKLEPVVLKEYDLPMMRIRSNYRGSVPSRGGPPSGSSIIATFDQWWSRGLVVRYWLFDSWYTARKEAIWIGTRIGAGVHLQSESNPEDVIGDATWYHVDQKSGEKGGLLLFAKNNVLVMVSPDNSANLQFAREVARKIEAKIEAVLEKK